MFRWWNVINKRFNKEAVYSESKVKFSSSQYFILGEKGANWLTSYWHALMTVNQSIADCNML
jgi:hypothetical protein